MTKDRKIEVSDKRGISSWGDRERKVFLGGKNIVASKNRAIVNGKVLFNICFILLWKKNKETGLPETAVFPPPEVSNLSNTL